jgi:hypothetical protein
MKIARDRGSVLVIKDTPYYAALLTSIFIFVPAAICINEIDSYFTFSNYRAKDISEPLFLGALFLMGLFLYALLCLPSTKFPGHWFGSDVGYFTGKRKRFVLMTFQALMWNGPMLTRGMDTE